MRVRASLRRICPSCSIVRRGRTVLVVCPANARHKQRQKGFSTLAAPPPAAAAATAATAASTSAPRALLAGAPPGTAVTVLGARLTAAGRGAGGALAAVALDADDL